MTDDLELTPEVEVKRQNLNLRPALKDPNLNLIWMFECWKCVVLV